MAEYLITKREKCEQCNGKGYRLVDEDPLGIGLPCACVKGYIDTPADLLEVLWKLRFAIDGVPSDRMENLRIEEGE